MEKSLSTYIKTYLTILTYNNDPALYSLGNGHIRSFEDNWSNVGGYDQ